MNLDIEKFVGPSRELSKLTVKSLEGIAEIQVKNISEYSRIGVEYLKSASEIKDIDGLKGCMSEQANLGKSYAEGLAADLKTIGEISQNYLNESKKIVEGSFVA